MTGQQLKNSILQLAIQGKLVPQDPNDEPASVLLQRIRKEKEQLVKEGKLKKKDLISEPITEDEKPFDIPENWEWCRLGEICIKIVDGDHNPPAGLACKTPFLMLSSQNVNNDTLVSLDNVRYLSEDVFIKEDQRTEARLGDILFTSVGTLGRSCVLSSSLNLCFQRSVTVLRTNIFNQYLKRVLDSPFVQDYVTSNATGTAQKGFYINQMTKLVIPLPPLSEQQRIVAKIEELMPLVEDYDKAQKELNDLNEKLPEQLKKSILQQAIMGKLVPQDPADEPASVLLQRIRKEKEQLVKEGKLKKKDLETTPIAEDEKPFDIPESWEWCRVKDILNVWSARRVHEKDWRTTGIPFYRAREIGKLAQYGTVDNELYIDESLYNDFSKTGYPKANDLMMTAVGTLGKCYVVKKNEVFYFKDGSVLCLGNIGGINPLYLKYLIESPMFVQQYLEESDGTTVATLTMVRMNEYLIPLPPLSEQHRIVAKIEELFAQLDEIEKGLN